jgi:hypothetical protein
LGNINIHPGLANWCKNPDKGCKSEHFVDFDLPNLQNGSTEEI